jgi:hypothetical protein
MAFVGSARTRRIAPPEARPTTPGEEDVRSRTAPKVARTGRATTVTLATICLNEEQFIGSWLAYHYDAVDRILICEGAARDYPHDAVTQDGLSSDATAEIIAAFPDPAQKISLFRYGWAGPASSTDDRVPA